MPSGPVLLIARAVALLPAALFFAWARTREARSIASSPAPVPVRVSGDAATAFQVLSDCSSDLVLLVDRDGKVAYASRSAEQAFGAPLSALRGKAFTERFLEADRVLGAEMLHRARRHGSARGTLHAARPCGDIRAYDTVVDASRGGDPGVLAISGRDVTEQVRLSAQLRQAQKLEAVGRMATGVAHEFNNLLAVIRSGTALARESLPPGHPAHADLADVATAADRGVAVTRKLLSFSRQETPDAQRADVSEVLAELASFIPRLVWRGHQVRVAEGAALGEVPLSATSLEQVVLNLAINARDATPSGGWIEVEARRVEVRDGDASGLPPGPHVEIAVHDQGTGMRDEVRRRLFEPFFTTKSPGLGSGLGLAISLGIVQGAGGTIEVDTEEGRGSVFRVLLPHLAVVPGVQVAATPDPPAIRRSRVLLVDHDPALVAMLSRLLAARGHEVVTAATAAEARLQAASFPGAVDVVLTGLELGSEHGVTILGEVKRTSPRARAVLLSSEVRDASDVDHLLEAGVELVRRPVPAEALVEVVERAAARSLVRLDPPVAPVLAIA